MCIIEINFYNVGTGAYFNNTGWAADYTHKLIGIPHLRQWRSKIGIWKKFIYLLDWLIWFRLD